MKHRRDIYMQVQKPWNKLVRDVKRIFRHRTSMQMRLAIC
jgi:hypothetical protein